MAKVSVKIIGLNKLLKRVNRLPKAMRDKGGRALQVALINTQRGAKRRTPVDTGRLRSSIRFEVDSQQALVGIVFSDVEYAPFIEFGTVKTPAQPFLFPAWLEQEKIFRDRLARILAGEL